MVENSEIKDEDSLKAWMNDQPRAFPTAIAARSALRVLPVFWDWSLTEAARKRDLTALPILRSNLIAAVACKSPTAAIMTAARAADATARATADATAYAADAADAAYAARAAVAAAADATARATAYAAYAADDAAAAVWENIRRDCADLEAGQDLLQTPLWRDKNPLADLWSDLRPKILSAKHWQPGDCPPAGWRFWVDWYEKMLDPVSNPPNWGLLEQVALISSETWEQGGDAVTDEIKKLATDMPTQSNDASDFREKYIQIRSDIEALETRLPAATRDVGAVEEKLKELSKQLSDLASGSERQFKDLAESYHSRFETALATYVGEQKVKAPVELWTEKQTEHTELRDQAWKGFQYGLGAVAGLIIVIIAVLCFATETIDQVLTPVGCDPIKAPERCNGFSFRGMIVSGSVLTLLTLTLWFTRIQMKQYLSERHLALDARERRAFAQTYIGLLGEGDGVTEDAKDQRAIVYAALFRPSSDGIISDDTGIDPSLTAALSKLLSRS